MRKYISGLLLIFIIFMIPTFAHSMDKDQSEGIKEMTVQECINYALENSIELKLLEQEVKAKEIDLDKADYYSDKLKDAEEKIEDGYDELNQQKQYYESIKDTLSVEERTVWEEKLAAAEEELAINSQYIVDTLDEAKVEQLLSAKASITYDLTVKGLKLAEKQVRLLIKKKFSDVIKAQRLVKVKSAAYERASTQQALAEEGYEVGFRAKDDMLMAQAQASLFKADYLKAKESYDNSVLDLKLAMNMDPEQRIKIIDNFTTQKIERDLRADIEQALNNRLEIKKAEGELKIAKLNFELAKRYAAPNTFDYREAENLLNKAELEFQKQQSFVKTEVLKSSNTLKTTEQMLDTIQTSVSQAEESLEIATLRYKEGYGIPTATLKALNLEDMSGTIVEVLATQEKLAEVEEKAVEIEYGYNLALEKYYNDISEGE